MVKTIQQLKTEIQSIRDELAGARGLPLGDSCYELLLKASTLYSEAKEVSARAKAERDEHGANLTDKESAGKADMKAKGSIFGKDHTEAEAISDGALEICYSLKKVGDYMNHGTNTQRHQ